MGSSRGLTLPGDGFELRVFRLSHDHVELDAISPESWVCWGLGISLRVDRGVCRLASPLFYSLR